MQSNREMFAGINLEPKPAAEDANKKGSKKSDDKKQGDSDQEKNTERIIRCMKIGLKTTLENISIEQKGRPLNPEKDFIFKAKVTFNDSDEGPARSAPRPVCCGVNTRNAEPDSDDDEDDRPALGTYQFTDYAPMTYRHIREFFSVDWKHFTDVLVESKWHSIPTPGKSAAQLFFCGQNWVVKTMTKEESKFLRNVLHRYYYHVRDNPHTLLPHFVGHHSLTLNIDGGTTKISFVIMQNVFATPNKIHEKFDLKGSTVGRHATAEERRKQTCTKKDLDINRPIRLGETRRQLLLGQMRRDCDFLRKASIMDYSFLIGIHRVDATAPGRPGAGKSGAEADERCFTADQGGMMSLPAAHAPSEVYYVGIIDILQEYNLWKRSETMFRGVVDNIKEISSVHPKDYASRFVDFMSTIIV